MFSRWSETALEKTEAFKQIMYRAERYLWEHPQTGFKEWDAHHYIKEKLSEMGINVTEAGNIPGFYFDIDTGKEGPTVAILGELDALVLPEHPEANKETGAVHACGHHCQSAALLGIAGVLTDKSILSELCGKIRIMGVPAEEMIELSDREKMRSEGKISYFSGKSEFMKRGCFDGVDIAIMLHGDHGDVPGLRVGQGTSGIITKRAVFEGSQCVSGACPENGVNALYAANTAMSAVNALRETFPHRQNVRVHSVITGQEGNLQFMTSRVVVESSVRAYEYDVLLDINDKVNRAYTAAAAAFGAKVTIDDIEIYLPENGDDSITLAETAYGIGCDLYGEEHTSFVRDRYFRSPGGTDMGNLGAVIPCIQPYICSPGLFGHSKTFRIESQEYAVRYHAAVLIAMACVLLENNGASAKKVISEYKPIFKSIGEYFEEMDRMYRTKNGVAYLGGGSAMLNWK